MPPLKHPFITFTPKVGPWKNRKLEAQILRPEEGYMIGLALTYRGRLVGSAALYFEGMPPNVRLFVEQKPMSALASVVEWVMTPEKMELGDVL